MKYILYKIAGCLVIILLLLMGCANSENAEIDEIKNKDAVNNYSHIGALFWAEILNIDRNTVSALYDYVESIEIYLEMNHQRAIKYSKFDKSEWSKDYIKKQLIQNKLFELNSILEGQIELMANQEINDILETGKYWYVDYYEIDIISIYESSGSILTYDEWVELYFRDFIEKVAAYEYFFNAHSDVYSDGDIIILDEDNFEDYKIFIMDLYEKYEQYVNTLYDEAYKTDSTLQLFCICKNMTRNKRCDVILLKMSPTKSCCLTTSTRQPKLKKAVL